MPKLVVENNQIVLKHLIDTGQPMLIDLPKDEKERSKLLSEVQEIADLFYDSGKATRVLLSKPCSCGCGR